MHNVLERSAWYRKGMDSGYMFIDSPYKWNNNFSLFTKLRIVWHEKHHYEGITSLSHAILYPSKWLYINSKLLI